jgi:hypothetical protein
MRKIVTLLPKKVIKKSLTPSGFQAALLCEPALPSSQFGQTDNGSVQVLSLSGTKKVAIGCSRSGSQCGHSIGGSSLD